MCEGESYTGGGCDDGNPCTTNDSCYAGVCIGGKKFVTGPCNDGNACTINDQCVFYECVGTPVSCDDGNICTVDSCDPATGECTNSPLTCDDGSACTADSCDPALGCIHIGLPEEAGPLAFVDPLTLQWGPDLGASIYNVYRGSLPSGGLGGRSPVYDHACFESGVALQLSGVQSAVDVEDPPVGTGFYYLVDGEAAFCGEGPLGRATDGNTETPIAFCPTPP